MDLASIPGSLGEFRIVAMLGQGGTGIVYDAWWGPRRVALKVLHPALVGTDRERAQFLAEAQRLQAIAHSSVVKVLAFGELPDRRPYLAMERLDGETLASVLSRGPLPLARALELFDELCGAIAALHAQGLVHRDLKPENVFIVADRHAVLLDFGIAKELAAPASTTTQDGGVRGTPAYMAPERFFGQPAGVATDIYELAVTLYAMLAGRLPWDEIGDPEARLQPRPLVDLAPVPAELDVEIRRAMSTRAQNRPASATAFLEAVRAAAGTVEAPASSETAKLPKQVTTTEPAKPWFADRQPTTDRGKTPLAWAPTAAAPALPAKKPRRRWPWIAAPIVVAGAVVAFVLTRGDDERMVPFQIPVVQLTPERDPWVAKKDPDPWGSHTIPDDSPKIAMASTGEAYEAQRSAANTAIGRLPSDTSVVVTVVMDELRKQEQFGSLVDKLANEPRVKMLAALMPPCVKQLVAGSGWLVFGMPSTDQTHGVLVAHGGFSRADVEKCFAPDAKSQVVDGAKLMQLGRAGWVDFIDDHTVYVAMRPDIPAAKVHELVIKGGAGPTGHTRQLLAGLSSDRTLAVAIDGARARWAPDTLPATSDVFGWVRVEKDGASLDFAIDPKTRREADKLEGTLKPQVDDLFANTSKAAVGKLDVVREATAIHVRGSLTGLMIGIITTAVP
jgi:serine/threonine protein kinase